MTPHWLLLLSLSLGAMAVPIDRNPGQQEAPKEEVPDENAVGGSRLDTNAVYHSTHLCGLTRHE